MATKKKKAANSPAKKKRASGERFLTLKIPVGEITVDERIGCALENGAEKSLNTPPALVRDVRSFLHKRGLEAAKEEIEKTREELTDARFEALDEVLAERRETSDQV